MGRPATVAVVLLPLVASMAIPAVCTATDAGAAVGQAGVYGTVPANASAEGAAPGATFAGAVEVQEAAVGDELSDRTFDVRLVRADSPTERAAVVAERVDVLTRRTTEIREHKQSLVEARANGSLSEPRFRAELAAIGARSVHVSRRLDQVEAASRRLPTAARGRNGVSTSAIETLRSEVDAVATSDVVDVARPIAGAAVEDGLAGGDERGSAAPGDSTAAPSTGPTASRTAGPPSGGNGTPTATLPGTPEVPTDGGTVSTPTDEPG